MGSDRHRRTAAEKGPPYVQLYHWLRATPAWRSLNPYARCLYIEMRGRYNGSNNGNIVMSYREAQELLGCSNKPIPGAFWELQDRGFIKVNRKGSFSWKVRFDGTGRATTWILTELRQDFPATVLTPSYEFKAWEPPEKNKARHAESVPKARPKRVISQPMTRPKRAHDTPKAGHFQQNAAQHGTLKAGTSNLPGTPVPLGQVTPALLKAIKQKGWSAKTDA